MDSVKQSAALCLLRLNRTSPDLVPMGEWTARVVHLLNDQHLVRLSSVPYCILILDFKCVVFSQWKWDKTSRPQSRQYAYQILPVLECAVYAHCSPTMQCMTEMELLTTAENYECII